MRPRRSHVSIHAPILVVSAFAPELAPLRRAIKRTSLSTAAIGCVPVGIGIVDAAVGTTRAIARLGPRLILFVGTAGTYGPTPPIGAVVIPRRMVLASTAVARDEGYLPAPMAMAMTVATDSRIRRVLRRVASADAVVADVATTIAITQSLSLARRLVLATAAAVENLEIFAVARAAHAARIPFGAVLGISNRVGPGAHAEWSRHQSAATRAATQIVQRFLVAEITAPNQSPEGVRVAPRPHRPRHRRSE